MTTDLTMLVATAVFCLLIPAVYLTGRSQVPGGFQWALGNRDRPIDVPPWVGRAVRAHQNMVENLAPFAILVLVAHVTGRANATTALGAHLFFWGRVAHLVTYVAGMVPLRTIAFFVATAGEILILTQLF
jgi:uncharacterized MAPEG superfamily protein